MPGRWLIFFVLKQKQPSLVTSPNWPTIKFTLWSDYFKFAQAGKGVNLGYYGFRLIPLSVAAARTTRLLAPFLFHLLIASLLHFSGIRSRRTSRCSSTPPTPTSRPTPPSPSWAWPWCIRLPWVPDRFFTSLFARNFVSRSSFDAKGALVVKVRYEFMAW